MQTAHQLELSVSHTFASWTWPLGLKGHHAIVILKFTSMALLASNKQDRRGRPDPSSGGDRLMGLAGCLI